MDSPELQVVTELHECFHPLIRVIPNHARLGVIVNHVVLRQFWEIDMVRLGFSGLCWRWFLRGIIRLQASKLATQHFNYICLCACGNKVVEGPGESLDVGEDFTVGDLDVHVRGANDPDAEEPVTYVVEHESGTFFAAGDLRPAAAFADVAAEFDLDMGVLAYGTVGNVVHTEVDPAETRPTEWYNDGDQIAAAANALQLDRLLPTHWDMWRGVQADPKALHEHVASYQYPQVLDVIRIGDRVDVDSPGVAQLQDARKH